MELQGALEEAKSNLESLIFDSNEILKELSPYFDPKEHQETLSAIKNAQELLSQEGDNKEVRRIFLEFSHFVC